MPNKTEIRILGGGFSGLIQAYYLIEAGYKVRIFERENRLGGLLGSKKENEFLIEQAANAFIANKELELVAKKIGVTLVPIQKSARQKYIYRDGKMCRWPLNVMESLPLLSYLVKRKLQGKKVSPLPGESLNAWGQRCLGKRITESLLEPAMRGVFVESSKNLDANLILSSLSRRYPKGSLRGSVAPLGGMQEWLDKMRTYLDEKGCEFHVGHEGIDYDDSVPTIIAIGLGDLKELVNQQKIQMNQKILKTQSASITSVTFGFTDKDLDKPEGFGCLFPKSENFNASGVLFNNNIFPDRAAQGFSETWILGDDEMEFSHMSRTALIRYVQSDRYQLTGKNIEPDLIQVSQWPERIPIYNDKLSEFLKELRDEKPAYLFVGNYLGDLGLSKILPYAIANVEKIKGGYFV